MARILVIGHLTLDTLVLHQDQEAYYDILGGSALGAAVGAIMTGSEVELLAVVGHDFPTQGIKEVSGDRISLSSLQRVHYPQLRFLLLESPLRDDPFYACINPGRMELFCPDIPSKTLEGFDGVHIAPMPLEYQLAAVKHAKNSGSVVSVDPHPLSEYASFERNREAWLSIMAQADIFAPSEHEFSEFSTSKDLLEVAVDIASKGPSISVLKLGGGGSACYSREGEVLLKAPAYSLTRFLQSSGAGDGFCGAFLSRYLQSKDILEALICGNAVGSLMVEHISRLDVLEKESLLSERIDWIRGAL